MASDPNLKIYRELTPAQNRAFTDKQKKVLEKVSRYKDEEDRVLSITLSGGVAHIDNSIPIPTPNEFAFYRSVFQFPQIKRRNARTPIDRVSVEHAVTGMGLYKSLPKYPRLLVESFMTNNEKKRVKGLTKVNGGTRIKRKKRTTRKR